MPPRRALRSSGHLQMTKIPLSRGGLSRPGDWSTPDVPPSRLPSERSARVLLPSDERLLGLLGEHGVLTTSQLVRLTGFPERTVQHRLGRLEAAVRGARSGPLLITVG